MENNDTTTNLHNLSHIRIFRVHTQNVGVGGDNGTPNVAYEYIRRPSSIYVGPPIFFAPKQHQIQCHNSVPFNFRYFLLSYRLISFLVNLRYAYLCLQIYFVNHGTYNDIVLKLIIGSCYFPIVKTLLWSYLD